MNCQYLWYSYWIEARDTIFVLNNDLLNYFLKLSLSKGLSIQKHLTPSILSTY